MKRNWQWLLAPDLWIYSTGLLAGAGIILMIAGMAFHLKKMMLIGMCLAVPFFFVTVIVVFVAIPFLIISNWKDRRRPPDS